MSAIIIQHGKARETVRTNEPLQLTSSFRVRLCSPMTLLVGVALASCGKPQQARETLAKEHFDSANAGAHIESLIFGPIWPHDSACFVWLHAEVAVGHLKSAEGEAAEKAFDHCTDTSELEARKHPLTAERRATMDARRAMGIPARPLISSEK